jgi:hypothetical protein
VCQGGSGCNLALRLTALGGVDAVGDSDVYGTGTEAGCIAILMPPEIPTTERTVGEYC